MRRRLARIDGSHKATHVDVPMGCAMTIMTHIRRGGRFVDLG